jgi:hypothetical protein
MLDAFIIDQLHKEEEQRWIDEQRAVIEVPCEPGEPRKKSEEERGVWSIQLITI